MSLFVNLPFDTAGEFLGVWLDLKTLVNLDSAFCNHEFRPTFNELITSTYCILTSEMNHWTQHSVDWLLNRRMKVSNVRVLQETESQPITAYLQSFGKTVRVVRIVSCKFAIDHNFLGVLASYTHNLWSFSLLDFPVNQQLNEVLLLNPQLRELHVEDVYVPEEFHFQATRFAHLTLLSLQNCGCSESIYLTHIDLEYSNRITDTGLIALAQHCPLLRCVGLGNRNVSDQTLSYIVEHCPQISHLNINSNEVVTDAGIHAIARGLSNLRSTTCENCTLLSGLSLSHLTTHCAHTLEIIHMYWLFGVRVSVFVSFLQKCTKLHTLSTNLQLRKYCNTIMPYMCNLKSLMALSMATDDLLVAISMYCTQLEVLELEDNVDLDGTAFEPEYEYIPLNYESDTEVEEDLTHSYSEKKFVEMTYKLPHLRVLNIEENIQQDRFRNIALHLWKSHLPALSFTKPQWHDVLKQEI